MSVLDEIRLAALPGTDIAVQDGIAVVSYGRDYMIAMACPNLESPTSFKITGRGGVYHNVPYDDRVIYVTSALLSWRTESSLRADNICQGLLTMAGFQHIADCWYQSNSRRFAAYIEASHIVLVGGDVNQARHVCLANPSYQAALQSIVPTL